MVRGLGLELHLNSQNSASLQSLSRLSTTPVLIEWPVNAVSRNRNVRKAWVMLFRFLLRIGNVMV